VAHAIVILAHHLPGQLARLIDRVTGPARGDLEEWIAPPGPGPGDQLARVDRWFWQVSGTRSLSPPNRFTPFDEYVFETILVNSRHRDAIVAENLHAVAWNGGHHPATLTSADLAWLHASDRFFARKLDDAAVLDRIDAELLALA
jgi:hypothetical protein